MITPEERRKLHVLVAVLYEQREAVKLAVLALNDAGIALTKAQTRYDASCDLARMFVDKVAGRLADTERDGPDARVWGAVDIVDPESIPVDSYFVEDDNDKNVEQLKTLLKGTR